MNTLKQTLPILAMFAFGAGSALAESTPKEPTQNGQQNTPLSEDECRAIWNLAAGRSDLSPDGAKPYVTSFEQVDTNRDKKISNAEFRAGCAQGFVHKAKRSNSSSDAGTAGSN